jgi:hypothetical protein
MVYTKGSSRKMTSARLSHLNQPGHLGDLGDVLLDELRAVFCRRILLKRGKLDGPIKSARLKNGQSLEEKIARYRSKVHRVGNLSALCLSGGGIRSAAFALGVVQGLAARGILAKFDYLSTVSGGGYIGAFLAGWVHRKGYGEVISELSSREYSKPLRPQRGFPVHLGSPPPKTKSALQHIRRYSSYLAPRKGLLTADALTIFALYLRNLILNWLILIPLILCLILAS